MEELLFTGIPPEGVYEYLRTLVVQQPDVVLKINSLFVSGENILNQMINSEFSTNKTNKEKVNAVRESLKNLNLTRKAFSALMSILWHSSLPCYDVEGTGVGTSILKKCFWKMKPISCSAIFKKVATDRGMCCAFNKKAADEIFVRSTYTEVIKDLEIKDKKNSIEQSYLPEWYDKQGEPISQAGTRMGLTVFLDAHTDQLSELSVSSDLEGFVVMVASQNDFPLTFQRGVYIKPGHANLISLSAIKIDADESIRNIEPKNRNCFFPDETERIKFHRQYSQANCLLECSLLHAQNELKNVTSSLQSCTPWFFPSDDVQRYQFCSPFDIKKILEKIEYDIPPKVCEYCLPDCKQVIYQQSVTTAPFRKCTEKNFGMSPLCNVDPSTNLMKPQIWGNQVLKQLNNSNLNHSYILSSTRKVSASYYTDIFTNIDREYDAFDNDIAELSVVFDRPTVLLYTTKPSRTWIDFISAVGGNGGLFIGFSIVTILEVVWLFCQMFLMYLQVHN